MPMVSQCVQAGGRTWSDAAAVKEYQELQKKGGGK